MDDEKFDTCIKCANAELHGYPPEGTPEWYAFTVSLFCPIRESYRSPYAYACDKYVSGEPKTVRDDADWGF